MFLYKCFFEQPYLSQLYVYLTISPHTKKKEIILISQPNQRHMLPLSTPRLHPLGLIFFFRFSRSQPKDLSGGGKGTPADARPHSRINHLPLSLSFSSTSSEFHTCCSSSSGDVYLHYIHAARFNNGPSPRIIPRIFPPPSLVLYTCASIIPRDDDGDDADRWRAGVRSRLRERIRRSLGFSPSISTFPLFFGGRGRCVCSLILVDPSSVTFWVWDEFFFFKLVGWWM